MKYPDLLGKLSGRSFFDLAAVVQLTEERRATIQMQLSRWCGNGKLIRLRRGMYAFPRPYVSRAANPAEIANHLYVPSYLSAHWALGYYGLVPEGAVTYTSVSSRVTRAFENPFGTFTYRQVKPSAFFGYRPVRMDDATVLVAEPEKALLDLWYLEKGAWTRDRLREMRFQNMELVDQGRLQSYAGRFASPRILRTTSEWLSLRHVETRGIVLL